MKLKSYTVIFLILIKNIRFIIIYVPYTQTLKTFQLKTSSNVKVLLDDISQSFAQLDNDNNNPR